MADEFIMTCRRCGPLRVEQALTFGKKNICKKCNNLRSVVIGKHEMLVCSDSYIRGLLSKGNKLKHVPQELIELKRATIMLKREKIKKRNEELDEWVKTKILDNLTKINGK